MFLNPVSRVAFLICSCICAPIVAQTESLSSRRLSKFEEPAETPTTGVALRPCAFKEVTPGETETAQVLDKLGPPAEDLEENGQRLMTYQIDPFQKVEVILTDNTVTSIVLHFAVPTAPAQLERELELHEIEATPVWSETGQLLGRAYPERGALLNFDPESKAHRATHLVLEPITAEPFILRVQNDIRHRYTSNVTDLEIARRLDPDDPMTLEMLSDALVKAGKFNRAGQMLDQALELSPGNARLTLKKAELLARADQLDDALESVRRIVADRPTDLETHARSEKLLGDLLTQGAKRDFARAIEHHMAAIKLIAPLANDKRFLQRRAAKELLIQSFLAASLDIAAGEWQAKDVSAEKWLASAREIAEAMINQDRGDSMWRLHIHLTDLTIHAETASTQSPEALVSSVTREIQRLNDGSGDPLFRRELDVLRVRGLFDAASIAHQRGQPVQARELARQAIQVIEPLLETREWSPADKYLLGRLYFFVGSSIAVNDRDHREATKFYEFARTYFSLSPPKSCVLDLGRHGERFVSMGASYFESGNRELGLRLTREGLETMREAAESGVIKEESLALPYTNLAAMYKVLGKSDESQELVEMASRINRTSDTNRR